MIGVSGSISATPPSAYGLFTPWPRSPTLAEAETLPSSGARWKKVPPVTMLEMTDTENSPGPRIASPDGSTVPIARGGDQVLPPSAEPTSQSASPAPQQRWLTIRIAPSGCSRTRGPAKSSCGSWIVFDFAHDVPPRGTWQ